MPNETPATHASNVTLIRSAELSSAAEYAYAASAPGDSRLVFLAGSCPLDPDGNVVRPGDYGAQTAQCLVNMEIALRAAGATITDVISTRVLVASTERTDLGTAWSVVRDRFGAHDVPSTLLGVTVLGYEGQLVEVEAVAVVRD
ncbi:RidA family protein [Frondihabitans australicus]|uniref:Enamine deaminase RidA (YjgF/YER057c/UK114 family) n=1 Tax=Frondihabitans australicus TaxID=386892 RepID=A0A495IGJ1_9MICO|nr:RidA family protein [Frondihabitans australicus]RKR74196.1 enamine deaminase RidA (YjgF/YER057c/UK114 family) [Frondihabitans australicus]